MPTDKKRFGVNPLFFVALSVLIILEGPALTAVLFLSAALHELGHFAAASLFGGRPTGFYILPIGMRIDLDTDKMSYRGEALTALAGPLANALLWGLSVLLARLTGHELLIFSAAANFFLAAVNLVPALPLDGGRIVKCVLGSKLESVEKAEKISDVVTLVSLAVLLAFGVYILIVSGCNISLVAISLFLLLNLLREKLPLNTHNDIVN